ncbi:MAG: hypothetical protein HY975_01240 [Candidatus Kerfeldbacteria bacterium]|nr:hypothetical protein [Candidatus Kerfeldbacteria bacterium]
MISRDILNYTLSVAIIVGVVFWVWLLWYIIRIFRSIEGLVSDFRDRLHAIDTILQTIREKLTSTHAQLSFLAEGLKQLMSFISEKRRTSRGRTSSRASDSAEDF